MSHDQLTPSAPASQASVSGQSHDQNEIPVKCGPIKGSLHCQKCNDTDFASFGNVRYISVTCTSCFTMGAYGGSNSD